MCWSHQKTNFELGKLIFQHSQFYYPITGKSLVYQSHIVKSKNLSSQNRGKSLFSALSHIIYHISTRIHYPIVLLGRKLRTIQLILNPFLEARISPHDPLLVARQDFIYYISRNFTLHVGSTF